MMSAAPSAAEQYFLELINRARANPAAEAARLGISLNEGLAGGTITASAKPPLAFNEHGAIMAATVLSSRRAVEMSVYVVRAFVKLREVLTSNTELARKLEALEKSVATLDATTRRQFQEVYGAIRALMAPPATKPRPIGFTADLEETR